MENIHEKAKDLAQQWMAFKKMDKPASLQGGTGGTFTAAATKAGYEDTPEGRGKYADEVLNNKDKYSDKMVKKANFYKNVIAKK
jgi:hypothetical protein